jgi:glucosyl-dolichyl phosphate glucuronosyltransferase
MSATAYADSSAGQLGWKMDHNPPGYDSPVTTFSVAICTRNRADLFRETVLAVFGQAYPKDRYEVLVIDNGSTDDTPAVAAALAAQAPVRFRFFEEPRLGISRARNKAAAEADFDYVAFADDDTVPAPSWLAALSATIEEHGALVVGGRVEDIYEDDFEIPRWFNCKYLKGFFRVDYRGKFPDVFRVRYPIYIGAGNSAYARRLFEQIQFPSSFGPAGKRRIKGSETFVNLALEMADVPIYFTDHAVVLHHVTPDQVTRRKLVKASYLSGIEVARREIVLLGGSGRAAKAVLNQVREVWGLLRADMRSPRKALPFCTFCRLVRTGGFVLQSVRLLSARRVSIGGPDEDIRQVGASRIT